MLKKVIAIKNVGRFRNSAAAGNPQLGKFVLLHGANGFGKTTMCAVFRSLQTGDGGHVLGRKTLGVNEAVSVELLLANGTAAFDGAKWNATVPDLAIFDGAFVAHNVYSGEAVDIDHKRNLYRVIIGQEGVALAEEEARLAGESRAKAGEITAAAKAIQTHVPPPMKLDQFLALKEDADIDAKIAEQEKRVEAVRQASTIQQRAPLAEIPVPTLPGDFKAVLGRTIDDIAKDAEEQVAKHIAAHGMKDKGQTWIADGMPFAKESCPFCGQSVEGLPLIAAYRALFGAAYKGLRRDIEQIRSAVGQQFWDAPIGRIANIIEQNRAAVEFWQKYCTFDGETLFPAGTPVEQFKKLGEAAFGLIAKKAAAPLEAAAFDAEFDAAAADFDAASAAVSAANAEIRKVNALIDAKKKETGAADLKGAQAELARLKAVKARHGGAIAQTCADHIRLSAEKADIETQKEQVRQKLEAHTKKVVTPYERRINDYLDCFNAGFRITETKHAYPGGVATSTYRIVINNTAVDVGDGSTPYGQPSFKNTLSAGDRSTLALAFFLAHLETDAGKAQKIVVFDDPFTSQDAFRRRQTVHEIRKIGRDCAQVIVLSHDATFLKQIWDKVPAAERVALQLVDGRAQGSKIHPMDIERACQGRVASEIDDLQAFIATGAGKALDLIKKMRVVLETHCRSTYPAYFEADDWLGDIVRKIRDGGEEHPAHTLYDELDQINDYTSEYHHGEDVADATTDQIDSDELTGFVRKTLKIVNALQA